jgi:DNA segregation ATPase FtsK/SpoIIIE, S-DNA-T family
MLLIVKTGGDFLFELLTIPAVILGAALIPKGKGNDKKKIEDIFKLTNTCTGETDKKKYPRFKSKHVKQGYTTYIYTLPLGLSKEDIEDVIPSLRDGLNKEVEFEYKGVIKLDVYDERLPKSWNYTKDLVRENTWEVPIGKNHKGVLYHDFDKYPHFIIGGVTRFGKTVLIKEMFTTLLLNQWDHVEVYILDLKGGLEFYKYKAFEQVREVACDVKESVQVLDSLLEELDKREKYFKDKGITNIVDTDIKKRTFIFIDEGADLSPKIVPKSDKQYAEYCQSALTRLIAKGGGLGFRILYCTQYPSTKSVEMSVKANIVTRLSFVASSQYGSKVILDEGGADKLPSLPGRALYKVEKTREIQVPYITDKKIFELLEGEHETRKVRKSVDDDRSIGDSENQTPTVHS